MSLVRRFEESLGSKRGVRLHHADCGGVLRHDDARNNGALHIVFRPIQRALIGEIGKSPADAEVFDPGKPGGKCIYDSNRLGQRSRRSNNHSDPHKHPATSPVFEGSRKPSSLANGFVAALRKIRMSMVQYLTECASPQFAPALRQFARAA